MLRIPLPWRRERLNFDPAVTLEDVARYIADPVRAAQAYWDLQHLVKLDLANVYLPAGWVAAGHRRFNVWLDRRMAPPHGERVTLEEWCQHYRDGTLPSEPRDGGDAA
jgi:hypothetical protein